MEPPLKHMMVEAIKIAQLRPSVLSVTILEGSFESSTDVGPAFK